MTAGYSLKDLNSLKLTVQQALVEKFLEGSERPCDENDFLLSRRNREKLTTDIKVFLENLVESFFQENNERSSRSQSYPDIQNELLALLIILCGQNVTLHPWNNEIIVRNCEMILHQILKILSCRNTYDMISKKCKINLTKDIFQILCGNLTTSEWKHYPASVVCFKWILEMIKQPDLSQYLQFVLPPALLLTDDFINENRILGSQCLNHIVQNLTIADLQLYHYGDVIYNALLPILRIREADLIQATIIPLVCVATKLEFNLGNKDVAQWSKFDDILEIYLENMELEQQIDLRYCYISNLAFLIHSVGRRIIRWSKRLLRIFDEYIQIAGKYYDEKATNVCLKAILKFMEFSSEVTSLHAKNLLFILLIAVHSSNSSSSGLQRESKNITIKCLKTVLESISETEKEYLRRDFQENLASHDKYHEFYKLIINVFENNI